MACVNMLYAYNENALFYENTMNCAVLSLSALLMRYFPYI